MSSAKLAKVELDNFMSFGHAVLDLFSMGTVLVGGENEDDSFESNGSGKTTLFESICWCLLGETTKGIPEDEVVNKFVGKDCRVKLTFTDGLIVERYRKHSEFGNKLILRKGEKVLSKKTVAETEKTLLDYLGVSKKNFQNLAYWSQEKASFFIGNTDTEQKTLLDEILELEKFEYAFAKTKEIIKDMDFDIQRITNEIQQSVSRIEEISENIEDLKSKREEASKQSIRQQSRIILQIEEKEKEFKAIASTYEISTMEADPSKVEELELQITQLEENKTAIQRDLITIQRAKANVQAYMENFKRKEALYRKGICPECDTEFTESDIDAWLASTLDERDALVTELEAHLETEKTYAENTKKVDIDIKALKAEKVIEYTKYNESKTKSELSKQQMNTLLQRITELKEELNSGGNEVKLIDASIENFTTKKEGLNEKRILLDGDLFKLLNDKKYVEFWYSSFGRSGIRSWILDNIVDVFNEKINEFLASMGYNNIIVLFSNKSILKSGEEREKISFKIIKNGVEYYYTALSGGEKTRVNIAVMLALHSISSIKKRFGVLILDETFRELDNSGNQGVMALLESMVREYGSIFIITHDDKLKSMVQRTLTVKKSGGFAEVIQ